MIDGAVALVDAAALLYREKSGSLAGFFLYISL